MLQCYYSSLILKIKRTFESDTFKVLNNNFRGKKKIIFKKKLLLLYIITNPYKLNERETIANFNH